MSFISILKKVGSVAIGIERAASPFLKVIPGAGNIISALDTIFAIIPTAIQAVEIQNPVDGQGKVKAESVIADFEEGLRLTKEIAAASGQTLTYDAGLLQKAISSQVETYNTLAELKKSFKFTPIQTEKK